MPFIAVISMPRPLKAKQVYFHLLILGNLGSDHNKGNIQTASRNLETSNPLITYK
jgi:hypothetical protein